MRRVSRGVRRFSFQEARGWGLAQSQAGRGQALGSAGHNRGKKAFVARTKPSKGFLAREHHRVLLTVHALVMIFGLLACSVVNRRFSPDQFWVQWVALAWGALFLGHLAVFSRGTLATMGRDRR